MAEWLNSFYSKAVLAEAGAEFAKVKNFNLPQFLSGKGIRFFENLKWKRAYVPLINSFQVAAVPAFVNSKEFQSVLEAIIGRKIKLSSLSCRRFLPGDYTVLYDELKPGKGFLFMLQVNPDVPWNEAWGGYTSFIDGSEEVVRVVPHSNALFIINNAGLKCFTKYVNHHALHPVTFVVGVALAK